MRTGHEKAKCEKLFPDQDFPVWGHSALRFPEGSGSCPLPGRQCGGAGEPSKPQLVPPETHAIFLSPIGTQHWTQRKGSLLHSLIATEVCAAVEVPSSVTIGWLSWAQTPEKNKPFLQVSLTSKHQQIQTIQKNPKSNASSLALRIFHLTLLLTKPLKLPVKRSLRQFYLLAR